MPRHCCTYMFIAVYLQHEICGTATLDLIRIGVKFSAVTTILHTILIAGGYDMRKQSHISAKMAASTQRQSA